mmetsp:Transcript_31007/g.46758  ORF Transcript_31007/g.46758 Transcript_31007/m.46758 type:complete len:218 (+) Transcript_31007:71-724(+)
MFSKLATAQMPGSFHSNTTASFVESKTTHPPSCVNTPAFNASSLGASSFQFLMEMSIIFCKRNVASSSGRRFHSPTTGSSWNLFTTTSPESFNSKPLSGQRFFLIPTAIASSIQGCAVNGLPMYPPITAGNVAHAPSPNSIPNSLRYGDISSSSDLQPVPTPNILPACPVGSIISVTAPSDVSQGKSTRSTNFNAASASQLSTMPNLLMPRFCNSGI